MKIIKDKSTLPEGWVLAEECWVHELKTRVKEISANLGIQEDMTKDDVLSDWVMSYKDDLGRMQREHPQLTIFDIQDILSFNQVLQRSEAMGRMGAQFLVRYPINEKDL